MDVVVKIQFINKLRNIETSLGQSVFQFWTTSKYLPASQVIAF